MIFARRFVFSVAFIAVATTIARAEESWIGRRVMPKAGAKFLDGERKLPLSRAALPLIVSKVDGEKLWVGWGWVERKQVIPADEAIVYYNQYLRDHPDSGWAYCRRAAAWAHLEEWDFVLEDSLEAIRRDPNSVAYRIRGRAWLAKNIEPESRDSDTLYARRALKDCDRAIKLDPRDAMAWSIRGDLWLALRVQEKALADYNEAIRVGGASAKTFLLRAAIRSTDTPLTDDPEQRKDVVSDLSAAIRLDPNCVEALMQRAGARVLAGDLDGALNDCTAAIQVDATNITLSDDRDFTPGMYQDLIIGSAYLSRATLWQKKGRFDKAVADVNEYIRMFPTEPSGYLQRGQIRQSQGQLEKALADLNKAISLDADEAEFYMARAAVRQEMGDLKLAVKDVETVLSLSREHKALHVTPSEVWQVTRASNKSAKQLDEAVGQYPNDAKAYRERGEYYLAQGELHEAKLDFSRALKIANDDAETHNLRGIAHLLDESYRAAELDFDEAIWRNPKNERYRFNRGVAWLGKGFRTAPQSRFLEIGSPPAAKIASQGQDIETTKNEPTTAIEVFNPYIKRDPKNARAYLNRGVYWQSQRNWKKALADYNQAIRFNPKSAKAHHNRGEVFWEMKQLDKALADFNEAIRLDPKLTHAYRRRGQVWQAKGQLEKALGDYKQAVRHVLRR